MEYIIYDTLSEATTRRDEIDVSLGLLVEDEESGEFNRPFSSQNGLNIRVLTDGRYAIEFALNASAMQTAKVLPNGKVNIKYDIITNQEEKNLVSEQYLIDNDLKEGLWQQNLT